MTREEQISNGFTEMMKGFWENQDLKVPDFEEPCKQEPCEDKRLYIKVFADLEPDDIAEKIYQICDEDKFPKVIESLKEYFDSEPCEDCVSREAVKDILHKSKQKVVITFEDFEELVNKLPSVTPTHKEWIPVSEGATNKDMFKTVFGYEPATDAVVCNKEDWCGASKPCNYCFANPNAIGREEDWWNAPYKAESEVEE